MESMDNRAFFKLVNSRYGALTVFANDTGAATESLLTYGEWAENEITFLQRFLTRGCTALDIGAYIGTHTLAFAQFVGPDGCVIAIEAQPDTFQVLKKNVEANAASDPAGIYAAVRLENAIASDKLGQIAIPTIDVGQESSFGSASLLETLTHVDVPTQASPPATGNERVDSDRDHAYVNAITVDSLNLSSCVLIKIDVEGAEEMVLRGALQTLQRCMPFVYCECNSLAAGLKSAAVLESSGYKVFAHVVDAFNPHNFFDVQKNIFGAAREVALAGIPAGQEERIRSSSARPCELVLDIKDADDLALALLNKPQYQFEVLRRSHAAETGGHRFLDENDAARQELRRLQDENRELQRLRAEEFHTLERRVWDANEEKSALAKQHEEQLALNAQLNVEIAQLKTLAADRDTAIDLLHAQATRRDADIARLEVTAGQQNNNISELRTLLAHRDTVITQLNGGLTAQQAELVRISAWVSTMEGSKSWRFTAPIRWASTRIRRLLAQ
jgi:FkbM family methyltransferase